MQTGAIPRLLLTALCTATAVLAACNQDNCYRALAGHSTSASAFCATYTKTVATATTGLPTYASPCSSSPARITSACDCVFPAPTTTTTSTTASRTCTPSPIINATFRNGDFNEAPYGPSQEDASQPPWFTARDINTTIEYIEEGSIGEAVFFLVGQSYIAPGSGSSTEPTSQVEIQNPITVCQETEYTISFLASQSLTNEQNCVLEIGWNDSNYAILEPSQLNNDTTIYGPIAFESTYLGPTPPNADGTFNTDLSVYVSCFGIKGVKPPAQVTFTITGIVIDPA
ncbi:hypothetical protein MMC06_002708 [Schaereria dolodes]|nr:hypothetical protein [Schaereria dolodes]